MNIFLIILGCVFFLWILSSFLFRKNKSTTAKKCSVCGGEPKYGYSEHAEDLKNIKSFCRKCLITQLEKDYATFSGRAVVIQPVPGPPCYVFHSNKEWDDFFMETRVENDVRAYLLRIH